MNNKKLKGKIDAKRYTLYRIIIVIALGIITSVFVTAGNYLIPLLAFLIASGLMYLVKTNSKELLSDERVEKMAGKAARVAYSIMIIFMALAGMILIAERGRYPAGVSIGYALSYLACGAMIIYIIAFNYYNRKKG